MKSDVTMSELTLLVQKADDFLDMFVEILSPKMWETAGKKLIVAKEEMVERLKMGWLSQHLTDPDPTAIQSFILLTLYFSEEALRKVSSPDLRNQVLIAIVRYIWVAYQRFIWIDPNQVASFKNKDDLKTWLAQPGNIEQVVETLHLSASPEVSNFVRESVKAPSAITVYRWGIDGMDLIHTEICSALEIEPVARKEAAHKRKNKEEVLDDTVVEGKTIEPSESLEHYSYLRFFECNQQLFQKALTELFPAYLPSYLNLIDVQEPNTKRSQSISEYLPLSPDIAPRLQIVGGRGAGKTNLLLASWQQLSRNPFKVAIGLTPELAKRYKSLAELIIYWVGEKKFRDDEIILVCDDFDKFPLMDQQNWLNEFGRLFGWIITVGRPCQIPSQLLRVCDVPFDHVFAYANKVRGRNSHVITSMAGSPVFAAYLNKLEPACVFIDLYESLGDVPTLAQIADKVLQTRMDRLGIPRASQLAARALLTSIVNRICDDKPGDYALPVYEIARADLELLDLLYMAGIISIDENRVHIEHQVVFDFLAAQRMPLNTYVRKRQTPAQRLYWQLIIHYAREELNHVEEILSRNTIFEAGYRAGQWELLADIAAVLPKRCQSLPTVGMITNIALSIQKQFPHAIWGYKINVLEDNCQPVSNKAAQDFDAYTGSLVILKGPMQKKWGEKKLDWIELLLIALGDKKSEAKNFMLRAHAFSALRDCNSSEVIYHHKRWIPLRERVGDFLKSCNDEILAFSAATLLLAWGDYQLVQQWCKNIEDKVEFKGEHRKWWHLIQDAAQGDQEALAWL